MTLEFTHIWFSDILTDKPIHIQSVCIFHEWVGFWIWRNLLLDKYTKYTKSKTHMIAELLSIFIQAVSVGAFKRSHWCTCRMRDTKRRRCCCCSPTAASVQDSYCTDRCSCKGWLQETQGEKYRSINNSYVNMICKLNLKKIKPNKSKYNK